MIQPNQAMYPSIPWPQLGPSPVPLAFLSLCFSHQYLQSKPLKTINELTALLRKMKIIFFFVLTEHYVQK